MFLDKGGHGRNDCRFRSVRLFGTDAVGKIGTMGRAAKKQGRSRFESQYIAHVGPDSIRGRGCHSHDGNRRKMRFQLAQQGVIW